MKVIRFDWLTWIMLLIVGGLCGVAGLAVSSMLFEIVDLSSTHSTTPARPSTISLGIAGRHLYSRAVNDSFWNPETMLMLAVPFVGFIISAAISIWLTCYVLRRMRSRGA